MLSESRKSFGSPDTAAFSNAILSLGVLATGSTIFRASAIHHDDNRLDHEADQGCFGSERAGHRT